MRKSITSQIGMLSIIAAIGTDGFPSGNQNKPLESKSKMRSSHKLALTKRQLKVRAKNKAAKKARRINRN